MFPIAYADFQLRYRQCKISNTRPWLTPGTTLRALGSGNIESQEFRSRENYELGYCEHPRAGGMDDLETLFSIPHCKLDTTFTLKDWTEYSPMLAR